MGIPRLAVAVALLVLVSAGALAVAAWERAAPPSSALDVHVTVVGPSNVTWFDADVRVANATALSALRATGLPLQTEEYPGMGTYVRGVGNATARGASGWVYEVSRAGAPGSWTQGDRSAALYPLRPGDALRWRWVDG
jgi:hypothetical protein